MSGRSVSALAPPPEKNDTSREMMRSSSCLDLDSPIALTSSKKSLDKCDPDPDMASLWPDKTDGGSGAALETFHSGTTDSAGTAGRRAPGALDTPVLLRKNSPLHRCVWFSNFWALIFHHFSDGMARHRFRSSGQSNERNVSVFIV